MSAKKDKKPKLAVSEEPAVVEKPKKKSVKKKEEVEKEAKIAPVDDVLQVSKRIKKAGKVRTESGQPKPIFKFARDKDKKCFAIGGVMTDIINSLKGQTYALAGTGFHPDGTPITREKGTNWEEQYTELLMYLATAEGLGCTYQGDFSRLKNFKSSSEASQALLDELSTDLRKMTLHRSALGPRHTKRISELDSEIKDIALRTQLANMQWDFRNMDRVIEKRERYVGLTPTRKETLDALVERVRKVRNKNEQKMIFDGINDVTQVDKDGKSEVIKKFTTAEREKFFFPPTDEELETLKTLTGIREKEAGAIDTKVGERKGILSTQRPTRFSMRGAADKVVSGLETVSEKIFGDLQEEKEAMRAILADSIGLYANDTQLYTSMDTRNPSAASKALLGHERKEFAKILEILGRLRLARESSEDETIDFLKKDLAIESSVRQNLERDVLEALTTDLERMASGEEYRATFENTLTDLMRRATKATDPIETDKVMKQLKAYRQMHTMLYGVPEATISSEELAPIKEVVREADILKRKEEAALEKVEPKPEPPKRRGRKPKRKI